MKKSVVFLGFYLWGVHGAYAESLDVFFQEQTPPPIISSEENPETGSGEPTVVKPQVLYLEDLNPIEKPKPKTSAATTKTKPDAVKTPQTTPVNLPAPMAETKPKTFPTAGAGKIKTEPLPETFTKTTSPSPVVVPPSAQKPAVQKSWIEPRNTQTASPSNPLPESTQTLSSFREHNPVQYAPFATQTSRQQAAHSLVTQAKNEGRSYPAGLDPFVIEFDQTFAVLSPNPAIRDLYKSAALTPTTLKEQPLLSFDATPSTAAPAPVLSITPAAEVEKTPETKTISQETQNSPQQKTSRATQPEEVSSPIASPNTLVLDHTPDTPAIPQRDSDPLASPLATVMVTETAQALDATSQNLLDQVAAAYHDGTLNVIHITGYVNTRTTQSDDVRAYTHIQSLGRRGAALVVDYLKQKQVPESAMAYRIIPTSSIALYNPFYASISSENTLRLDVAGGRS